jgi:hypothetical protein
VHRANLVFQEEKGKIYGGELTHCGTFRKTSLL